MIELRGHRERHVKKEWSVKARNYPRVASARMIGRVEETSASYEARSAPQPYPTAGGAR
jgi:hypothetical protein